MPAASRWPGGGPDAATLGVLGGLLDRLLFGGDAHGVVRWVESSFGPRDKPDVSLLIRLARAHRELEQGARAAEVLAQINPPDGTLQAIDSARLGIERGFAAVDDGALDRARAEALGASRTLDLVAHDGRLAEALDLQLLIACIEGASDRLPEAAEALRLADTILRRLEAGPWCRTTATMAARLAMSVFDPAAASGHYRTAIAWTPAIGPAAAMLYAERAGALCSAGHIEDARESATQAIKIAGDAGLGWELAEAYDALCLVEIAADRPLAGVHALDQARLVLGDAPPGPLHAEIALHRALGLAMLGRSQGAERALAEAIPLTESLLPADQATMEERDAIRARTLEALGRLPDAIALAAPYVSGPRSSYAAACLSLICARAAHAQGNIELAQRALERAALLGDAHGWWLPDRPISSGLWTEARRAGDSRVVRYAERVLGMIAPQTTSIPPPPSSAHIMVVAPAASGDSLPPPGGGDEELIYVTTPNGVVRGRRDEIDQLTGDAELIVNTFDHTLRFGERALSLGRRRALEPLLVELLRRARDGLSAEEVLLAAGGPGPESADAEHRVRVLISRIRDLLGSATTIERIRDAGERGRTRYRLAPHVAFALVEPLYAPGGG